MKVLVKGLLGAVALAGFSLPAYAETTLTIPLVNNSDLIRMQKLSEDFTSKNPDIKLNWLTLEENVLRQKTTTDVATKGGQFDVLTIGTYEVPIWAKKGWLAPLDKLGADYDVDDLLPAIRAGLSYDGKLYAEWWTAHVSPISSSGPVDDGLWHHVVLTTSTDGTTQTLNLDGTNIGTLTGTVSLGGIGNPTNLSFGAGYIGGDWPNENYYRKNGNTGYLDYLNGQIADITLTH